MNNNYSQDNYVLNKDTLKQYETPLPFETQDEKTQNMDQFQCIYLCLYSQEYIEFQEVLVRVDFLKRVYLLLTLEFLINFGMIALGLYKKLLNLFVNTNFDFLLP
ncbi:unnamed protein product [Paramecium primaurelia]|uniref:Transmembrane protein n=1 Tax=Paramecium primaurelia TaxID=5886 RepID=A0A8S1ME31_PARPR|nr:unnamed protein product [Paramecium primaurelia]